MALELISKLGLYTLKVCSLIGDFTQFLARAIKVLCTMPLKMKLVRIQIMRLGVESSLIIILTGSFTGLALALQAYVGFSRFGAESFIGGVVAMAMTRDLGPVLAALMITARAGSAMAAELAMMNTTEQIDALRTLCIDPYQYLIIPRLIAGIMVTPCLALFSMLFGIASGFVFCTYLLALNPEIYFASIRNFVEPADLAVGLIKAGVFGVIISWVGAYYGYHARGERAVGSATTRSVVVASVLILVTNYLLSSFLLQTGLG